MKFKDIKAGDIVYIDTKVIFGFMNYKSYWLPTKVDSVSPKQFTIKSERYKKEDGKCIGEYSVYAMNLGDRIIEGFVKNQEKQRNDFVKKLNKAHKINELIKKLKVDHRNTKLSEIHYKLKDVETLITEGEISD